MLLQEVHNLLQALLLLNVEAVAELLLVLPVVHHFGWAWPDRARVFECAMRVWVQDGTVIYGYLDGLLDSTARR